MRSCWHSLSEGTEFGLTGAGTAAEARFGLLARDEDWFVRGGRRIRVNRGANERAALEAGDVISSDDLTAPHFLFLGRRPIRHTELERGIIERDNDADWLVYADWLQQHADPLGTALMQCQTLGLGHVRPNFLFVRALTVGLRYCFWVSAEIDGATSGLEAIVAALWMFPQGRFLRSLKVTGDRVEASRPLDELLAAWIGGERPASLESVELGPVRWSR
jgi:uncharacterized protein (TIGR02996 family)